MKIGIFAVALLIIMAPMVIAENDTRVNAESVTMTDVRMKKVGESVNDFFFNVKSAVTFNQESKVSLIEQRNEQLRERQDTWLEMKQKVFAESQAEGASRNNVAMEIRNKHEAIIKEHLELTAQLRQIRAEANASNNVELNQRAKLALEKAEASGVRTGIGSAAVLGLNANGESETSINSSTEARAKVEKSLGLESVDVETRTRNGVEYFVVIGVDNGERTEGSYEVWIRKSNGAITNVDVQATIDVGTQVNIGSRNDTTTSSSTRTETSINNGSVRSETRIGIN